MKRVALLILVLAVAQAHAGWWSSSSNIDLEAEDESEDEASRWWIPVSVSNAYSAVKEKGAAAKYRAGQALCAVNLMKKETFLLSKFAKDQILFMLDVNSIFGNDYDKLLSTMRQLGIKEDSPMYKTMQTVIATFQNTKTVTDTVSAYAG